MTKYTEKRAWADALRPFVASVVATLDTFTCPGGLTAGYTGLKRFALLCADVGDVLCEGGLTRTWDMQTFRDRAEAAYISLTYLLDGNVPSEWVMEIVETAANAFIEDGVVTIDRYADIVKRYEAVPLLFKDAGQAFSYLLETEPSLAEVVADGLKAQVEREFIQEGDYLAAKVTFDTPTDRIVELLLQERDVVLGGGGGGGVFIDLDF
jgi:hypothetical protein